MYCIVGLRTSHLLLILPCICPIFFLSIDTVMKFFVNDFCETVQARIVIFGEQVDNDVLYRGIANQPSPAYSSLYLSNFLSFYTLIMKFFVKDFCETVQARIVIFGMQVDNDVLYGGIANQPSIAYSSLYLYNFLSFHTLNNEIFVKVFCETMQARVVIFGMQVDNDVLYRGTANQPSPAYSSLYSIFFLSIVSMMKFFVKDFCETVQARRVIFGMQVDNDVLRTSLLLLILPCICPIFFLSIL